MKLKILSVLIVLSICLLPVSSFGMDNEYKCQTVEFRMVDREGVFSEIYGKDDTTSEKNERSFVVNRNNGSLLGNKLSNSSTKNITVVGRGSQNKSFKVISIFDSGTIQHLEVFEWFEGEYKPFYIVENNTLRSGICK